jgi:hypothetical protein
VEEPPLALPAALELVAGDTAHVYPLPPAASGLLMVEARASEGVGLALERRRGEDWYTLAVATGRRARLEVPLASGATGSGYRLRLWSLDRRESPVRLALASLEPVPASERELSAGLSLIPAPELEPRRAVAAVRLERPGLLRAAGAEGVRWCTAADRPCAAAAGGLIAATGERVLLVADAAVRARAERVALVPGAPAITVPLPEGAPLLCDVAAGGDGPLLLRAESLAGQPGVDALTGLAASAPQAHMAPAVGAAVSVTQGRGPHRARLWRASPGAAEVRLRALAFPAPGPLELAGGLGDGALDPEAALRAALAPGGTALRLALDPALVAVLSRGDAVEAVVWGGGAPLVESLDTHADHLTLLHTGDPGGEARFALEALPLAGAGAAAAPISPGHPLERRLDREGRLRVSVAALPEGGVLHVRGAAGDAVLLDDRGRVQRGADLELAPAAGATLLLPHAPGLLLAWSAGPGGAASGPWLEEIDATARQVTPPSAVPLAERSARFEIRLGAPAVLHLRAATPAATRLSAPGRAERVDVHPDGVRVDAFLPEGSARLTLRALVGTLSGRAELTASPVTPAGEGLGPEVLLAPGGSRFFSFRVARPGLIGIGVRATRETVEARLLDASGATLGTGTAQMPRLEPGLYLLELRAPAEGAPVRARAALVGLTPPDTGPPEEVVRQYLERYATAQEEDR